MSVGEPPARNRVWARMALLVASVAAAAGALWVWREPLWGTLGDPVRVREWIAGFGLWGPLVSIALNIAQVLLAPLPGHFVGVANGYLYGLWPGTFYSMAGLVAGTALAMAAGRWGGRPLVERLVAAEKLARWDCLAGRRGPLFFFLVFLLPFLPDDLVCFLIGLSPLEIPRMLVLAAVGRLPGVFVSCWIGSHAAGLPLWAWLALGVGAAVLAWLFWRHQAWLEAATLGMVHKLAAGRLRND